MEEFKHIIYTGQITVAWAYMYHLFPNHPLPIFTRASFDAPKNEPAICLADANHTTKILLSNLEQTLTSPSFPKLEKEKLVNAGLSLLYAYEPHSGKNKKYKTKESENKQTVLMCE